MLKNLYDERTIDPDFNYEVLSLREKEIFALARAGLSNNEIAEKLMISKNTVHNHMCNIYRKLDVSKRR